MQGMPDRHHLQSFLRNDSFQEIWPGISLLMRANTIIKVPGFKTSAEIEANNNKRSPLITSLQSFDNVPHSLI